MAEPQENPFEAELQRREPGTTGQPNPFEAELDKRGESAPGMSVFGTPLPTPGAPSVAPPISPTGTPVQSGMTPPASLETLDDTMRMLASGASLSWADEMAAGMNTLLGIGPGKTYEENLQSEMGRDEAIREREPGAAFAAEMVGGVGAAVATGGTTVAGAKTLGGVVARSAGVGGATGTVAGAGYAKPGERLTGALIGTALGTSLGIAIPLGKEVVMNMGRRVLQTKAGKAASASVRKLLQALQRDELTADQAFARMQEIGPEGLLADVGENVRGLGRAVAGQPGRAKKMAVDALEPRQEGQGARLVEAVNEALDPTGDFAGSVTALQAARKSAAKPLYDAAHAKEIVPDEQLIALFRRPALKQAWEKAKTIAANEGDDLPDNLFTARPDGGEIVNPDALKNVKLLDYVKRGLDDLVESKRDPVTGKIQGEVQKGIDRLRKQYIATVDKLAPEYKAARAAWSGPTRSMELMERGRRFVRADQEITAGQLAKMSDDEKFFFRMGAARQVRDLIYNVEDGGNAARRIFGSKLKRDRLRAVFPDDESFAAFRKTIEQETEMFRTRAIVSPRSGSQTDLRAAERSDLANEVGGAISELARGNKGNAAMKFMRGLFGDGTEGMTPEAAEKLAGMLFQNDPATNRKIINALVLSRQLSVLGKAGVGTGVVETTRQGADFLSPGQ